MSNEQNKTPKSPYQSNRGTPNNQSEPSLATSIKQPTPKNPQTQNTSSAANRVTPKDKPSTQSTPTKNRSADSTPYQSQTKNKQVAPSTQTNSIVCTPRDKNKTPGNTMTTTQRSPQSSGKPLPLFKPAVTSTPKSPIRETEPRPPSSTLRIDLKISGSAQERTQSVSCSPCAPCPPCPRDSPNQPQPAPTQPEDGRQICFSSLPSGSATCIPQNATSLNLNSDTCVPEEPTPSKGQSAMSSKEGIKKERLLKLEILSISGGTLYDLDKIHQQTPPPRTPIKTEPIYDPRFDIDRMEALQPAKKVSEGDSETARSEDRKRGSKEKEREEVEEENEHTVEHRSLDDEGTFRRDDSNFMHDSSLMEPPAAPRKSMSMGSDEEHDVMRSAPAAPVPFNLSDLSLPDIPPDEDEREMTHVLPLMGGQDLGIGDDYAPVGDVSVPLEESGLLDVPLEESGLLDIPDVDDTNEQGKNVSGTEGARRVKREAYAEAVKLEGTEEKGGKEEKADLEANKGEADKKEQQGDTRLGKDEEERKMGKDVKSNEPVKEEESPGRKYVEVGADAGKDVQDVKPPKIGGYEAGTDTGKVVDVKPLKVGGYEAGGKDGQADTKGDIGQLSDTQADNGTGTTDRKDGGTINKTPAVAARPVPAEREESVQAPADERTEPDRGSISLILGPSVRNFAHLALSPLTTWRTFLGPAPNARPRPTHKKRFKRTDESDHPEYIRMRSIRSAFVVTPYDAAATSLGFFLTRRNRKCARKTGSTESESSSEDE